MERILSLDISNSFAEYFFDQDHGRVYLNPKHNPSFTSLLDSLKPTAIGLEYSGRLAEPWCRIALSYEIPVYILHTVERKAYNRINRQRTKTDRRDAETIGKLLRTWMNRDLRAEIGYPDDLFTDYRQISTAWELRGMLSAVDALTAARTKAKQRATASRHSGNKTIMELWEKQASTKVPEEALQEAMSFCEKRFPEETGLLLSIPHVGPRLATYAIATLLPVDRFPTVKHVCSYVGLHARHTESGNRTLQRPYLARTGHKQLRSLLYLSCMQQVGKDTRIGKRYARLRDRGMNGKSALVNCAAALLRTIYAVLSSRRPYYDPDLPPALPQAPLPQAPLPSNLITQADAARILGLTRQAINLRVKRGKIPTAVVNGKTYILKEALNAQPK